MQYHTKRAGAAAAVDRWTREKSQYFGVAHVPGMAFIVKMTFVVKQNEAPCPMDTSLLGSISEAAFSHIQAQLIHEARWFSLKGLRNIIHGASNKFLYIQ